MTCYRKQLPVDKQEKTHKWQWSTSMHINLHVLHANFVSLELNFIHYRTLWHSCLNLFTVVGIWVLTFSKRLSDIQILFQENKKNQMFTRVMSTFVNLFMDVIIYSMPKFQMNLLICMHGKKFYEYFVRINVVCLYLCFVLQGGIFVNILISSIYISI